MDSITGLISGDREAGFTVRGVGCESTIDWVLIEARLSSSLELNSSCENVIGVGA